MHTWRENPCCPHNRINQSVYRTDGFPETREKGWKVFFRSPEAVSYKIRNWIFSQFVMDDSFKTLVGQEISSGSLAAKEKERTNVRDGNKNWRPSMMSLTSFELWNKSLQLPVALRQTACITLPYRYICIYLEMNFFSASGITRHSGRKYYRERRDDQRSHRGILSRTLYLSRDGFN